MPPSLSTPELIAPIFAAWIFIAACSLLKEPSRRNLSVIMLAGAGAAYLSGGLGAWEFAFCTVISVLAYWGFKDYRFIGAGWLLHAAWDVLHHLNGHPIIPLVPSSSAGCAICDVGLAFWYFKGAPSILGRFQADFRFPRKYV